MPKVKMSAAPIRSATVFLAGAALFALAGCQQAATTPAPSGQASEQAGQKAEMAVSDVSFLADDGLMVSGRYYRAARPKAIILLFHQADSSQAEYATIAPRLVKLGYSALAIDQRSGGSMFGPNLTAARLGRAADYNAALRDLEAALAWSRDAHLPTIVWGSSYSSALVFKLAAKHQTDIDALLAFSPGEYLGPGKPVATAAATVKVPTYISVSNSADELAGAKPIFDAIASSEKTLHVPPIGVHGSSSLITDRNPGGAEENWSAVNRFLAAFDAQMARHLPKKD
jgi:dienelactone hydrolase